MAIPRSSRKSPFLPINQSGRSRRPPPSEQVLKEVGGAVQGSPRGNKGAEEKLTVCKRVRAEVLALPPLVGRCSVRNFELSLPGNGSQPPQTRTSCFRKSRRIHTPGHSRSVSPPPTIDLSLSLSFFLQGIGVGWPDPQAFGPPYHPLCYLSLSLSLPGKRKRAEAPLPPTGAHLRCISGF